LETIKTALDTAGTDLAHVVRVTYMLPDRTDFEPCWPVLREAFGENPPATTMIECGLIDPKYRIEIEVTAVLPS
jgi:enamine deaminase RidA (YjgF/YER057c/UK114 family)